MSAQRSYGRGLHVVPLLSLVPGLVPQVDPVEDFAPMRERVGHSVGYNPYQRGSVGRPRHRAGAPLIGPSSGLPYPNFATAQGGNPALVPNPAMTGTRTGLPFPTSTLQPSGTGTSSSVVQGIFRPSRLIVAISTDTTGATVSITALLVGSINIFVNANPMTCAVFQATGVECGITFPTAHSGWTIQINFTNLSATTTSVVSPAMLGEYIQGGNHVIAG
jgi:hypothetical protein